jgi:hypothetical protein
MICLEPLTAGSAYATNRHIQSAKAAWLATAAVEASSRKQFLRRKERCPN